jgi:hypothetical protein
VKEAPICASLFPLIVQRHLFLLSAFGSLFFLYLSYISMAKSKKKSSLLQFAQQNYRLHSSRPSSTSRAPRSLSCSRSPVLQDPLALSRASTPSRTKVIFAYVAGSSHGVKVCSKGKKRDMWSKPFIAPSPFSPASRGWDDGSSSSAKL